MRENRWTGRSIVMYSTAMGRGNRLARFLNVLIGRDIKQPFCSIVESVWERTFKEYLFWVGECIRWVHNKVKIKDPFSKILEGSRLDIHSLSFWGMILLYYFLYLVELLSSPVDVWGQPSNHIKSLCQCFYYELFFLLSYFTSWALYHHQDSFPSYEECYF